MSPSDKVIMIFTLLFKFDATASIRPGPVNTTWQSLRVHPKKDNSANTSENNYTYSKTYTLWSKRKRQLRLHQVMSRPRSPTEQKNWIVPRVDTRVRSSLPLTKLQSGRKFSPAQQDSDLQRQTRPQSQLHFRKMVLPVSDNQKRSQNSVRLPL